MCCRGWQVALHIARGLHHMHSRKVMHLDLKSANILLARDGTAKVADVGLAKILTRDNTHVSMEGTFDWAAPEVIALSQHCWGIHHSQMGVIMHMSRLWCCELFLPLILRHSGGGQVTSRAPASSAVPTNLWPVLMAADLAAGLQRLVLLRRQSPRARLPARLTTVACRCWRDRSAVRRRTSGVWVWCSGRLSRGKGRT